MRNFLYLIICSLFLSCQEKSNGYTKTELWGAGIISTEAPEFATTINSDQNQVYFNRTSADRSSMQIMYSVFENNNWSDARTLPFSTGLYRDVDPFLTADGKRLYFSSDRPLEPGSEQRVFNTWYVEKINKLWSAPINPGPPLNSDSTEIFVTMTKEGDAYFVSERDGERGIMVSRYENYRYQAAEKIVLKLRGYEGHLNFDVVSFPKLLQDGGYHTSISGKWHQAYPAAEKSLWPDKRGFDRSFCLMQGGAGHFGDQQLLFSFFEKTLYTENGEMVDKLPDDFYSSDYYTQKAIEFIDESQKLNKPFFSYLTYTAPHWPLQIPDEYVDLYKGQYDEGYEMLASNRFEKAKQLGIISESATLPPLSPNVLPWNELSPAEQQKTARIMEVYAAMIERLDANVGKLIAHLKSIGQYENTLIVFMADNGAEGNYIGAIGDTEEWVAENFDNSIQNIGRRNSYVFTGPAWAQVSSLPFKWYKSFSTEGGVRCPSIISYQKWKHNKGKINDNFLSVMDLSATFLELAGLEHPGEEYDGRKIYPMDGISMVDWLEGNAQAVHESDKSHCWELYGRRAVRKGDWKAEWQDEPYGNNTWELYNLQQDPGELDDLAQAYPEKLQELIAEWDLYVIKYEVTLPDCKVAYSANKIWREE